MKKVGCKKKIRKEGKKERRIEKGGVAEIR